MGKLKGRVNVSITVMWKGLKPKGDRLVKSFIVYVVLFKSPSRATVLFCYFTQFLWKRALKDRFKYVRRPIEDDEQVMRNKCKFGHRRGQRRKSPADIRFDEMKIAQIKVRLNLELFWQLIDWLIDSGLISNNIWNH